MKVPQADDLNKVLQIPLLIKGGVADLSSLAVETKLTTRQVQYYSDAAEILGFIEKKNKKYSLTERGEKFVTPGSNKKQIAFDAIKQVPLVIKLLKLASSDKEGKITKKQISNLIEKDTGLSISTSDRRANSVFNWFYWMSYHFPQFCNCREEGVYCNYHGKS